jgi:hypothetical protein
MALVFQLIREQVACGATLSMGINRCREVEIFSISHFAA